MTKPDPDDIGQLRSLVRECMREELAPLIGHVQALTEAVMLLNEAVAMTVADEADDAPNVDLDGMAHGGKRDIREEL
jgi:hypothetical protein